MPAWARNTCTALLCWWGVWWYITTGYLKKWVLPKWAFANWIPLLSQAARNWKSIKSAWPRLVLVRNNQKIHFQLRAACERRGIRSAYAHFGKTQFFEIPCISYTDSLTSDDALMARRLKVLSLVEWFISNDCHRLRILLLVPWPQLFWNFCPDRKIFKFCRRAWDCQ